MNYTYAPKGVCSREMQFQIEDNIIKDAKIIGGCPGNTAAVCKLIIGRNIDEVINLLEGTPCGFRGTSCPDQLAKALKQYKEENQK